MDDFSVTLLLSDLASLDKKPMTFKFHFSICYEIKHARRKRSKHFIFQESLSYSSVDSVCPLFSSQTIMFKMLLYRSVFWPLSNHYHLERNIPCFHCDLQISSGMPSKKKLGRSAKKRDKIVSKSGYLFLKKFLLVYLKAF